MNSQSDKGKIMTNADYQKRLSESLQTIYDTVAPDPDALVFGDPTYTGELGIAFEKAQQALTALCRDVCGEAIGQRRTAKSGDWEDGTTFENALIGENVYAPPNRRGGRHCIECQRRRCREAARLRRAAKEERIDLDQQFTGMEKTV